jgi:predicted nucleotidyltransferase
VEEEFPGRLRALVLYGSRARGDRDEGSDWDVAAFIEGLDRGREGRRLSMLVVPFHLEHVVIAP